MYRVASPGDAGPERTRTRRRVAAVLAAVAALQLAGCRDDPAGPPGQVTATLVSPNGAEGAALLELSGDGVIDVKPAAGSLLQTPSGGTRQIAVLLRDPGKIALTLSLADRTRPPEIRILQVSGPDDRPRALAGYRVQIDAPVTP